MIFNNLVEKKSIILNRLILLLKLIRQCYCRISLVSCIIIIMLYALIVLLVYIHRNKLKIGLTFFP